MGVHLIGNIFEMIQEVGDYPRDFQKKDRAR